MKRQIQAGDVVQLKSGIAMTVEGISDLGPTRTAHVVWMTHDEKRSAYVSVSALKMAK